MAEQLELDRATPNGRYSPYLGKVTGHAFIEAPAQRNPDLCWACQQPKREHVLNMCPHRWSEPTRAANRFGRRSTSLYETTCSECGTHQVRNGLRRLRREVIDHVW